MSWEAEKVDRSREPTPFGIYLGLRGNLARGRGRGPDPGPARVRFTLLHVTSQEAPDAARGAYAGLFGRGGPDPAARLAQDAAAAAARLLQAAADRIGQACGRLELQGQTERVVVTASAHADLLIVARDGDQARLGPRSLGRATRFVIDHAACPVLLAWPGTAPGIATVSPPPPAGPPLPPHHPSPRAR